MEDKSGTAFQVEGMGILGLPIVKDLGLTKRELFAAMAMQGMCAHGWCDGSDTYTIKSAVALADALLAALEGKEG